MLIEICKSLICSILQDRFAENPARGSSVTDVRILAMIREDSFVQIDENKDGKLDFKEVHNITFVSSEEHVHQEMSRSTFSFLVLISTRKNS